MSSRVIAHVRGNVVGYVALVFAMGGSAYAASSLPANSVGTKQLKNSAVTTKKLAQHSVGPSIVKNNSLTGQQINASTLGTVPNAGALGGTAASIFNKLLTADCTGMGAISKINSDGTPTCQATGSGTITGVTAGTDLTGGGTSGNVTLNADETKLQHRVAGCSSGNAIQSVAQDGAPTCQAVGSGTITGVTAAGTGLTGGGTSGNVTLTAHPPTQVMGGTIGNLSGTGSQFVAPSGLSTPNSTESAVTEGTSATTTTAGQLSASVATAPGTGNSWTVDFDVNGTSSTSISCTIPGTATSCTDTTHTASIPPGSTIDIVFIPFGATPATRATFGWTATS